MLYEGELMQILSFYQNQAERYKLEYENGPEGIVIAQNSRGNVQLMVLSYENGKRIRRGINKDKELQKALARKEFARRVGEIMENNAEVIREAVNRIKPVDLDEVVASMGKGYALLPEEYFFDRDLMTIKLGLKGERRARIERHREWEEREYYQSDYHEEHKTIRTSRGLQVRSKSEALILESLYNEGISPHYDQELWIGDEVIAPDFTFEGADGRPFYWEHLGMMDSSGYADHNMWKLNLYHKAGIKLGERLILSCDYRGAIDMRMIHTIIECEVIPRL